MRILIAEDDCITRATISKMLSKWGYETLIATNGVEAQRYLAQDDSPKLVILDWMMPGISGVELCRKIREMDNGGYYYIILLSAKKDQKDVIYGLEAGADDYLTKPLSAGEMRVRIRCGVRVLDLQANLLAVQEELRLQAIYDSLTGVLNCGAIFDTFERQYAMLERKIHDNLSVVMLDLDHFKLVNDQYGHAAGDIVLKEVAARMKTSARNYDFLGRYGGEEFILVLPKCTLEQASKLANRLCKNIASTPISIENHDLSITTSCGVASTSSLGLVGTSALLAQADKALYKAKAAGRNCVRSATDLL